MSKKHIIKSPLLIRFIDYTRVKNYSFVKMGTRIVLTDLLMKDETEHYLAMSATPNFCDVVTAHYSFPMVTLHIPNRVHRRNVCPVIQRHFI